MGEIALHDIPKKLKDDNSNEAKLRDRWLHRVLAESNWPTDRMETGNKNDRIAYPELTGAEGRADYTLKIGKRIVVCIELKAANKDIVNDDIHRKQAVKYASSYYLSLNGVRDPVMAICTNGLDAYICDPALNTAHDRISSKHFDLRSKAGLNSFIQILSSVKNAPDGSLPILETKRQYDIRPFASNTTDIFEGEVNKMMRALIQKQYKPKIAVEMVTQILLLAAARDNGIIPNGTIRLHSENKDWKKLAKHLNHLFGDVFEENISEAKAFDLWEIYTTTSNFGVRLDILPALFMGTIYEKLVRKYFENDTSYFTPDDMIEAILLECKPTINDTILDPTCGSGAFLSKAIGYACNSKDNKEKVLNFFNSIVGVDKDPIACKVAKVTLLCSFMRIVGEEYRKQGKALPRPRIECADFFDWDGRKFSLILGNPPWENIDVLSKSRKEEFKMSYEVYEGQNDQLCYIIEKSIRNHLSPFGRFGFIIKLQSLLGDNYRNFCNYLDHKVESIIDYGRDQKFGNYAQSAGICGKTNSKKWSYNRITPEKTAIIIKDEFLFGDMFDAYQGPQSANTSMYKLFAKKFPRDKSIMLHPTSLNNGAPPSQLQPILFVPKNGVHKKFKYWALNSVKEKSELKKLSDKKFTWKENFKFRDAILITEYVLKPGRERFPFVIDQQKTLLPSSGQLCIAPKNEDAKELYLLASLFSSSHFVPLCRGCDLIPRRGGGIFFNPNTVKDRLKLPIFSSKDSGKLIRLISKVIISKRDLTEIEIKAIDLIVEKYIKLGTQKNASFNYTQKLLSDYLQPDNEVEDLEVA